MIAPIILGGAIFGGIAVEYPAFNLKGLDSLLNGKQLFPLLFITIACGACSGFHGVVASGTTSKQLARYILQEFTGLKGRGGVFLATAATLALPLLFLLSTKGKGYLVAWPIFGSSNQLLAVLTLLALAVGLKHSGCRVPERMGGANGG